MNKNESIRKDKNKTVFTSERQKLIEAYILERGSATVQELSGRFQVSAVTIRKDLDELEKGDLVQRTHGGAVSKYKSAQGGQFQTLTDRNREEKQRIGKKAVSFIENGDTIFLDASTTAHVFASLLAEAGFTGLTVITTSLYVAQLLLAQGIRVIMIGGEMNRNINAAEGPAALEQISGMSADKGFIGVNGIDKQFGFSVDSLEEAAIKQRSICQSSRRTFILADYTKFNRRYMARIFGTEECAAGCLITDGPRENIDYGFLKNKMKLVFAE